MKNVVLCLAAIFITGTAAAAPITWDLKITNDALKGISRASLTTKVATDDTVYEVALNCASDSTAHTTLTFYDRNSGRGKSPRWQALYDESSASQAQFSYRIGNRGINSGFMKRDGAGIAGLGERRGYANVANIDNHWLKMEDLAGESSLALGGIFSDESFVVPLQWSTDKFKKFACVCAANKPQAKIESKGPMESDPNFMANLMSLAQEVAGMGMNRVVDIEKLGNIGGCPIEKKASPAEMINDDHHCAAGSNSSASCEIGETDSAKREAREAALAEAARAREDARNSELDNRIIQEWGIQLTAAIQRVWSRPWGTADKNLSCVANMQLSPSGDVQSVAIKKSSGDADFDNSVVRAVYKASPMPLPRDPKVFQSGINIMFSPR